MHFFLLFPVNLTRSFLSSTHKYTSSIIQGLTLLSTCYRLIDILLQHPPFPLSSRFRSLTTSTWIWMASSTSAPTPTTRTSTSVSRRRRSLRTSSTTWRCCSGSSSPGRCSSWPWTEWLPGPRWTSREAGDSGKDHDDNNCLCTLCAVSVTEWHSDGSRNVITQSTNQSLICFSWRSAKEAEDKIKKALEKGEVLPSEARFDSNCITPGM